MDEGPIDESQTLAVSICVPASAVAASVDRLREFSGRDGQVGGRGASSSGGDLADCCVGRVGLEVDGSWCVAGRRAGDVPAWGFRSDPVILGGDNFFHRDVSDRDRRERAAEPCASQRSIRVSPGAMAIAAGGCGFRVF